MKTLEVFHLPAYQIMMQLGTQGALLTPLGTALSCSSCSQESKQHNAKIMLMVNIQQ